MKNRKLLLLIPLLILALFIPFKIALGNSIVYFFPSFNVAAPSFETRAVKTLADLAYGNNTVPNRVYIVENEKYVPYLVLTDNYNGNCLLLREFLLAEPMPYNDPEKSFPYPAYYEDSTIDQYLNTDFYSTLSDYVSSQMIDSSIVIIAKESTQFAGRDLLTIQRKVFLLSFAEVDWHLPRIHAKDGDELRYFSDAQMRIAHYEDGELGSWWLRSPTTANSYVVYAITPYGASLTSGVDTIGGVSVSGVRPAFCLPGDLSVVELTVGVQTKFVLSEDDLLE